MLDTKTHFTFPSLQFVQDVNFKSRNEQPNKKTTPLYRLDWTLKKAKDFGNYAKWHSDRCKENPELIPDFTKSGDKRKKRTPYVLPLPSKYDQWTESLYFAIPNHYMKEIHQNTQKAVEVYKVQRSFDTMIREICYYPAHAHVQVAFKLIADCAYDIDTAYYYRGDDQVIMDEALLYKFWCYQTGRGLLRNFSGIEKLERSYITGLRRRDGSIFKMGDDNPKLKKIVLDFIHAIDDQEEKRDKMYDLKNNTDNVDEKAPSLNELHGLQDEEPIQVEIKTKTFQPNTEEAKITPPTPKETEQAVKRILENVEMHENKETKPLTEEERRKYFHQIIINLYENNTISQEDTIKLLGTTPEQAVEQTIQHKKQELKDLDIKEIIEKANEDHNITLTVDNLGGGAYPIYNAEEDDPEPIVMRPEGQDMDDLISRGRVHVPQYPINQTTINALLEAMQEALDKKYNYWCITVNASKDRDLSHRFGFIAYKDLN